MQVSLYWNRLSEKVSPYSHSLIIKNDAIRYVTNQIWKRLRKDSYMEPIDMCSMIRTYEKKFFMVRFVVVFEKLCGTCGGGILMLR